MKIESKKLLKIKNISHRFFSNKGGVSKGIYKSLNCGLGSRDSQKNILQNLDIIKKKFKVKNLNLLKQIHSNKIVHLKKNNNYNCWNDCPDNFNSSTVRKFSSFSSSGFSMMKN